MKCQVSDILISDHYFDRFSSGNLNSDIEINITLQYHQRDTMSFKFEPEN